MSVMGVPTMGGSSGDPLYPYPGTHENPAPEPVNPYFVDTDGAGHVALWKGPDSPVPEPVIYRSALPEDVWVAMLRGLGIRPEGEDE